MSSSWWNSILTNVYPITSAPTKYSDPGLNLYTPIAQPTAAPTQSDAKQQLANIGAMQIGPNGVIIPPGTAAPPLSATPFSLTGGDPKLNFYQNEQAMRQAGILPRVMPTPSAYQVGLYRHMIWKILQNDDPALMAQLQARLTPQGLFNALTYLLDNQLDALSGPQNDPLFNNDPARLGVVVDDIAVWLAELDARQRAKIAAAAKAKGASVLPVMTDSTQILLGLLLVAGGFGAMWFIRRNKEQKNF